MFTIVCSTQWVLYKWYHYNYCQKGNSYWLLKSYLSNCENCGPWRNCETSLPSISIYFSPSRLAKWQHKSETEPYDVADIWPFFICRMNSQGKDILNVLISLRDASQSQNRFCSEDEKRNTQYTHERQNDMNHLATRGPIYLMVQVALSKSLL